MIGDCILLFYMLDNTSHIKIYKKLTKLKYFITDGCLYSTSQKLGFLKISMCRGVLEFQ